MTPRNEARAREEGATEGVFVAVVQYGVDHTDLGAVFSDDGALWVVWPDSGADMVFRDAAGRLWDEYGDVPYIDEQGTARTGTRLRVHSRRKGDGETIRRLWREAMDALEVADVG